MKRTTLIKAVVGAAAISMLSAGVAFAADSPDKTTATVTVAGQRSIALKSDNVEAGFAVANAAPVSRSSSTTMVSPNTYTLDYVTDYVDDIKVAVTGAKLGAVDNANLLGATKVTLHVNPGGRKSGTAATGMTYSTADLANTDAGLLVTGIDGTTTEVVQTVGDLSFSAETGAAAVIGANNFTLTYSIAAH